MAKTSDMKARIYSKYGREIYVSAKAGGVEISGNLELRGLVERAKKDQVPAHVIEKALEKARGTGGEDFARARYEGFGPGGCMVIIDCLTDNPNRTFGDVRICFTKTKCKIGTQGSVSHMFDHSTILVFKNDEEAVLEALMMADVDVTDIEQDGDMVSVFAPNTEYFKAKTALGETFTDIDYEVDDIQFLPQNTQSLTGDDLAMFEKFIEMLEDVDDVQNIYHNVDL